MKIDEVTLDNQANTSIDRWLILGFILIGLPGQTGL